MTCAGSHTITQAAAASRPIDRCLVGAGLLTHVLVGKFYDHLSLYRQSQIYVRDGVAIDRSTLVNTEWRVQRDCCNRWRIPCAAMS